MIERTAVPIHHAPASRPGITIGFAAIVITILAALIRTPDVLIEGRFWCEDGSIFARDLIRADLVGAVTYVYKGTLQLGTALPVWLATRAPVDDWPLVATWMSLGVEAILAALYLMWATSSGISRRTSWVGLFAILLHPLFYEISATTTNVQWITGMCALFVLLMPEKVVRESRIPLGLVIVMSGLTGVPANMLAPLFVIRGLINRSYHLAFGVLLSLTTGLQLALIVSHPVSDPRFQFDFYYFAVGAMLQTIWVTVAGIPVKVVARLAIAGPHATLVGLALTASGLIIAFLVVRAAHGAASRKLPVILLVVAWLLVTMLNVFGAIGTDDIFLNPPGGARYFAFGSVCMILLVVLVTRHPHRSLRLFADGLLIYFVLLCVVQRAALRFPRGYGEGPSWRTQLEHCRTNPRRPCDIRLWPAQVPPSEKPWQLRIPQDAISS